MVPSFARYVIGLGTLRSVDDEGRSAFRVPALADRDERMVVVNPVPSRVNRDRLVAVPAPCVPLPPELRVLGVLDQPESHEAMSVCRFRDTTNPAENARMRRRVPFAVSHKPAAGLRSPAVTLG